MSVDLAALVKRMDELQALAVFLDQKHLALTARINALEARRFADDDMEQIRSRVFPPIADPVCECGHDYGAHLKGAACAFCLTRGCDRYRPVHEMQRDDDSR